MTDDFIKKVLELYNNSTQELSKLYEKSRKIDNLLVDYYHAIEVFEPKHVSQSHKLLKKLQLVLRERRTIKEDISKIKSIQTRFEQINRKFIDIKNNTKRINRESPDSLNKIMEDII